MIILILLPFMILLLIICFVFIQQQKMLFKEPIEYPYHCNYCGIGSPDKQNLEWHIRDCSVRQNTTFDMGNSEHSHIPVSPFDCNTHTHQLIREEHDEILTGWEEIDWIPPQYINIKKGE